MIPVGDVIPSRTSPRATFAILGLAVLVWLAGHLLPGDAIPLILTHGAVPAHFSWVAATVGLVAHAGLVQLATNALVLGILGRAVEDRLGHARFLAFYVVTGYAGTMAAVWAGPSSLLPVLGASAAVGGVIGGYLALFPRSRILLLVPARDGLDALEVPALLLPGFWFLAQMIWSVAEQIARLSQLFEIKAGDLIMSGTPENVGAVVPGETLVAKIAGLPDLSIKVVKS